MREMVAAGGGARPAPGPGLAAPGAVEQGAPGDDGGASEYARLGVTPTADDGAVVHHMTHAGDFDRIQAAIDVLNDALLSHLSYEEWELVEPLARLGFHPGQV